MYVMHAYMCLCDVFLHVFGEKRPSGIDKIEIIGTILEFIFIQAYKIYGIALHTEIKTSNDGQKVMKIVCTTFARYIITTTIIIIITDITTVTTTTITLSAETENIVITEKKTWKLQLTCKKYIWAETDVTFSYQSQSKPQSAFQMQHEDYRKEFEILPHFFVNENLTRSLKIRLWKLTTKLIKS